VLVDAFAGWVAKLALAAEALAVGPQGSLAWAGAGWAMAIAALVLDAVLIESPDPTVAYLAMGLAAAGVMLSGFGLFRAVTPFSYPLSVAAIILNGLLGFFAFAGLAAAYAHLVESPS